MPCTERIPNRSGPGGSSITRWAVHFYCHSTALLVVSHVGVDVGRRHPPVHDAGENFLQQKNILLLPGSCLGQVHNILSLKSLRFSFTGAPVVIVAITLGSRLEDYGTECL